MTLPLHAWVGLGCFIHRSHHHGFAIPSTFGVNSTNPSYKCRRYVQEKSSREVTCVSPTTIHYTPFFHDCHPEPYIIRSFSPPSKSFAPFRVIDVGFIKALLWQITSFRHQLIIQEVDLGTPHSVLWSLHASMASFSLPATGIHQWPSTRRFCVAFDAKSFIHATWIVLPYLEGHRHYWWFLSRLLTVFIIDR